MTTTDIPLQYALVTLHGAIAIEESGRGHLPVLLIHGNSMCRGVFRHQMTFDQEMTFGRAMSPHQQVVGQIFGSLSRHHRLIAIDLPGHGQSSNARDPAATYTIPGLADAVLEILELRGITDLVIVGASLGGHVALEMASHLPGLKGLMLVGTPPVSPGNMAEGFIPSPHLKLASQQDLSPQEIEAYGKAMFGISFAPFLRQAIARTDGRLRKTLFESARTGAGIDQRWVAENLPVPLAIVNGAEDPFINLDYLDSLSYANLWEGRCHRLAGLGHAPYWQAPDIFNAVLERFLADIGEQINGHARPR